MTPVVILSILLAVSIGLLILSSKHDVKIIDDQATQIRRLANENSNYQDSVTRLKRQLAKLEDEKAFDLSKMNDDEIKKLIENLPPKLKGKLRKLQNAQSASSAEVTRVIKNIDFDNHDIF